mgnify:CR=1 FL=1
MTTFLTQDDINIIRKSIPTRKVSTNKTKRTKETISSFLSEKRAEGKEVRRARFYGFGVWGVTGIRYQEVTKIVNQSDDDWKVSPNHH